MSENKTIAAFPVKRRELARSTSKASATGLSELSSAAKLEKLCQEILDAVRDLSVVVHEALEEGDSTFEEGSDASAGEEEL